VLFSCIPPIAGSLLGALTHFIPSLTPVLSHIYSGPDIDYAQVGDIGAILGDVRVDRENPAV
jgi:hypothetical protein